MELVLTDKEVLVGNVKSAGSLLCNNSEIEKFRILHGRNRAMCKTTGKYGGPIKLVDIQVPLLLSSRLVDP